MTDATNTPSGDGTTPPRRRTGRTARVTAPYVRITVNLEPDLYTMINIIADNVGLPVSRVLNLILRSFHDAENSSVDNGSLPGKESNLGMVNRKMRPQRFDTIDDSRAFEGILDKSKWPDVEEQS